MAMMYECHKRAGNSTEMKLNPLCHGSLSVGEYESFQNML